MTMRRIFCAFLLLWGLSVCVTAKPTPTITVHPNADGVVGSAEVAAARADVPAGQPYAAVLDPATTTLQTAAFYLQADLVSVEIGGKVTRIPDSAFGECKNLKSVTLGRTVQAFSSAAFAGCVQLTDFAADEANPDLSVADGVLFSKNGTTLVRFPPGRTGSYVCPANVTACAPGAFAGVGLAELTLPENLTDIPQKLCSGSARLAKITLPKSANTIGEDAFSGTPALKTISALPANCQSIGANAFFGSGIEEIKLPDGLRSIGDAAFSQSALREITLPKSLETIGDVMFSHCKSLTSVTFNGSDPGVATQYNVFRDTPDLTITYPKDDKTWKKTVKAGIPNVNNFNAVGKNTSENNAENAEDDKEPEDHTGQIVLWIVGILVVAGVCAFVAIQVNATKHRKENPRKSLRKKPGAPKPQARRPQKVAVNHADDDDDDWDNDWDDNPKPAPLQKPPEANKPENKPPESKLENKPESKKDPEEDGKPVKRGLGKFVTAQNDDGDDDWDGDWD